MSLDFVDYRAPAPFSSRWLGLRSVAWLMLVLGQSIAISWLFELPYWFSAWGNPFTYMRQTAVWALISGSAFAILVWPRRSEFADLWRAEQLRHRAGKALAINLVLFAILVPATYALTVYAVGLTEPPLVVLALYGVLLLATAGSLLRIDINLSGGWHVVRSFWNEALLASCAGLTVLLLSLVSLYGWETMAEATLLVSKAMLELFETDVAIYPDQRMLRIDNFAVIVTRNCSGYEGIALVVAFLSLYLWVFRDRMRFPRAFLLYPIGIVAIWLLNAARIAALAALGAHVSPAIAVQGFHSQAGWIAFLAATLGMMALAQRSAFCRRAGETAVVRVPKPAAARSDRVLLAYLAPFMGLMLASIAVAAASPHDRPLYALKVLAVAAVLWLYRDVYAGWSRRISWEALLAGAVVGIAWIASDPGGAEASELGAWLARQSTGVAALWLAIRVIGATITVPIAEELAFRGLLHRWIIARDFDSVPFARYAPVAFVVSSLLFGLMHERWLAGALAGAVFAMVMYRTRDIAGPIAAHIAANAIICAWALAFRQWSLL